jgi:hypothetical protein
MVDPARVDSLLGLGALAMVAVDAVVGVRLLLLAQRTRELPEAALGAAFVLLGAIGYPLSTAARRGLLPTDDSNALLMAVGFAAQNLACLAIYWMTARTFRAGERWARGLVVIAGLAFLTSYVGHALDSGFRGDTTGSAYYLGLVTRTGAFAWTCFESLRQYTRARRRLALGLVDPLVANRFLLFGLGTGGVFAAFAIFLVAQLLDAKVAEAGWVLAATGAAGLFAAVPTWLAFLPPPFYRRWFEARA